MKPPTPTTTDPKSANPTPDYLKPAREVTKPPAPSPTDPRSANPTPDYLKPTPDPTDPK